MLSTSTPLCCTGGSWQYTIVYPEFLYARFALAILKHLTDVDQVGELRGPPEHHMYMQKNEKGKRQDSTRSKPSPSKEVAQDADTGEQLSDCLVLF